MHLRHRRHSNEWPPTSNPSDPDLLHWRQTRVEETVDDHQDRLAELEARPSLPSISSLPWLQIVGLALLLGLGATGRISPETLEAVSKLLPGR